MDADDSDMRWNAHDEYLTGAEFCLQSFGAVGMHEHEHCEFCWTKFMDPNFSDGHRAFIETNPDVLTRGYASTESWSPGIHKYWVCPTCFEDFRQRLGLRLVT